MIRADMISIVGRKYLTSNIENDKLQSNYPRQLHQSRITCLWKTI